MKKIIYILSIVFCLTTLISCEKTSEDPSKITYFVDLSMNGDEIIIHPMGQTFNDPGCVAIVNEEDISSQIVVKGAVNTEKGGMYTLNYSAANEDGISKVLSRVVYVYDTTESPIQSGFYTTLNTSYRVYDGGAPTLFGGYQTVIIQTAPGKFYASDLMGGWYHQRAGYVGGAMIGNFILNEDNSIELVDSYIDTWKDGLDFMDNAKCDPENGTIYWEVDYAEIMTFFITLSK